MNSKTYAEEIMNEEKKSWGRGDECKEFKISSLIFICNILIFSSLYPKKLKMKAYDKNNGYGSPK